MSKTEIETYAGPLVKRKFNLQNMPHFALIVGSDDMLHVSPETMMREFNTVYVPRFRRFAVEPSSAIGADWASPFIFQDTDYSPITIDESSSAINLESIYVFPFLGKRHYYAWEQQHLQRIEESLSYQNAEQILEERFDAYAEVVLSTVARFSSKEWQPRLYKLLSELAVTTGGKYKPVVSVNEEDGAFELEVRIGPHGELFLEVSRDGELEIVLYDDRHGAKKLVVQTISQLMNVVCQELAA